MLERLKEVYIASERNQFGDQIDFIPRFMFYDESEAMKYKKNTCKAVTIETCSMATEPVKPLCFLYIEVNTHNGELIKSEIKNTNNYDVALGENINDIYVLGNKMIIKKSCPKDFVLNDENLITQIAKNIIDDVAMRIDKDYEMTCFKPSKEITEGLLKEFEQLF